MKQNKIELVLIFCIIFAFGILISGEKKKTILISKITTSSKTRSINLEVFQDKLKSKIIEKFSSEYRVLTEDDLELFITQAEEIQKHGKDASKILSQIADARDSDEYISGKLFLENGKFKVLLNNISNSKLDNSLFTKSVVDISFDESELEHFVNEISIKILYPKYKMNFDSSVTKKISFVKENLVKEESKTFQIGDLVWGEFEGVLKWDEANSICLGKGMRLPTPEEVRHLSLLKSRYMTEPCCVYWTSLVLKKDDDYAYYINVNDGFGNYYHKELDNRVRCVKRNLN